MTSRNGTAPKEKWIITSLLDMDFYKFTMGQFIFLYYPNISVTFGFTNRTKGVLLPDFIDQKELRRQLDHVRSLRFTKKEITYLRSIKNGNHPMFFERYLDFLDNLQMPQYLLIYTKQGIILKFTGSWDEATYWETIALSIINELYYRSITSKLSKEEREAVQAEADRRLEEKIELILAHPHLFFSDFGTRRRFSFDQQDRVVGRLVERIPKKQFRGTSNTMLAMKYGITPMGTNAHELVMIIAGILGLTDEELRNSQTLLRQQWFDLYGPDLAVILPDTYGSDYILATMTREEAQRIKGFRHDSGDPIEFGEKVIAFFSKYGIDPATKMVVWSDGLDIHVMLKILAHFQGRLLISFGWGTNLTNDMGYKALSLVVKAVEANGRGLVKLSDNIAKAMGPTEEIERYTRVFEYGVHSFVETVY